MEQCVGQFDNEIGLADSEFSNGELHQKPQISPPQDSDTDLCKNLPTPSEEYCCLTSDIKVEDDPYGLLDKENGNEEHNVQDEYDSPLSPPDCNKGLNCAENIPARLYIDDQQSDQLNEDSEVRLEVNWNEHLGSHVSVVIDNLTSSKQERRPQSIFHVIRIDPELSNLCNSQDKNNGCEQQKQSQNDPKSPSYIGLMVRNREKRAKKSGLNLLKYTYIPHDKSGLFRCYACKEDLNTERTWLIHVNKFVNLSGCYMKTKCQDFMKPKNVNINGVNMHKCSACGFIGESRGILLAHSLSFHKFGYNCAICPYKIFSSLKLLQKHIGYIHNPKQIFHQCSKCDYKGKSRSDLNVHFANHSNSQFNCDKCNFVTVKQKLLDIHVFNKHSNRPRSFICHHCSFATTSKRNITIHLFEKHPLTNRLYFCKYCKFETNAKKRLRRHMECIHMLRCPECDYVSKIPWEKTLHQRLEHKKRTENFICSQCEFKTHRKDFYFSHLNINHKNQPKFSCGECKLILKDSNMFMFHVYKVHDPKIVLHFCAYCPYKSRSKLALSNHMIFKHNFWIKLYKCKRCKYVSKTKEHLVRHNNIRHNPNAVCYQCFHCGWETKIKSKLSQHMQTIHNFLCKKRKLLTIRS